MRASFRLLIPLLVLVALLSGCATAPKGPENFRPGATVETLTASVSLSVKTPSGGTGGSGYLVYRRPDRFRMVMLTPFGTTALELCTGGNKVSVVIPSKGTAYVGTFDELPERNGMQAWRLMQWAVEGDPFFDPDRKGSTVRSNAGGRNAHAIYNGDGVLERKLTEDGSQVVYRDYQSMDGVPFPAVIEFSDDRGAKVKITLKEPEINQPLEEGALAPHLEGMNVLPLSSFREM